MRKFPGGNGAGVFRFLALVAVGWVVGIDAPLLHAQEAEMVSQTITVARGSSAVVTHPTTLERVLITDPEVADAVPVSGTEVVLNGNQAGSTTLLFWGLDGTRATYTVRVMANSAYLQDELARLMPGSGIQATAAGNSVILSGEGIDPRMAERALTLAANLSGEGIQIVDHISVPDRAQILLRVRLAEVNRSVVQNLGSRFIWMDPDNPQGGVEGFVAPGGVQGSFPGTPEVTFSDAVNFYLFHDPSNVAAFIRALRDEGGFRSLAEPNLLAFPGEEASFLAGGEFPFPMVQGQTGAISVQFREFGIRLRFVPEITNSGAIRLEVEPEVSQLDFGAGLTLQGFTIPALTSRRVQTVVELQENQTFAIAGLMDAQSSRQASKIPFLGEIPIIGGLFQSRQVRDSQNELLVLVTPELVYPQDQAPPVPTGEIPEWDWDRYMRQFIPVEPGTGSPSPDGIR